MKNQKGITLIVLIITIIVMLILVGVSVSVALNSGLFKSAQGAGKNTQIAADEETKLSNGTIKIEGQEGEISIGDYVASLKGEGEIALPENLQIGDIIEYTPASNYKSSAKYSVPAEYVGCTGEFYTDMGDSVEWKVIGIEESTIKIIPKAVSSTTMTITGANGWNNSINALNNVCGAIYGNITSNKYTATAKSLTAEDINKIAGYTPKPTFGEGSVPASYLAPNSCFPIEYLKEKEVSGFTDAELSQGYAANLTITLESTSYQYSTKESEGFNTKFENWMVFGSRYWLASRSAHPSGPDRFDFCVYYMSPVDSVGWVSYNELYRTFESEEYTSSYNVRPVVSLTPKVLPTLDKTVGEGTSTINYWVFE